jgi:hypothetical protein
MPEREPRDLDVLLEVVKVLWEIVRYFQVQQQQKVSNQGEAPTIAEIGKLAQVIASLSNSPTIHIQDALMNDYYQVGQAGAVGPNAIAIGQNFFQIWSKQETEIDLNLLAQELRKVREIARASASGTPDQDVALGELANAEVAAGKGDGPRALSHLARVGQWALCIAREIGVPVAVKAIETAIGKLASNR